MPKNIAVLSYYNNRVANLVIKKLCEKKIKIKCVILIGEEEKKSVKKNYLNYTNSLKGVELKHLKKYKLRYLFVKNTNSLEVKKIIKRNDIKILLNYSGLIKEDILNIKNLKILNSHPGMLPFYRGSMCPEWTIFNKEKKVAVTSHILDKNLDTGPIVVSKKLKYPYPRNYFNFRKEIYELEGIVTVKAIRLVNTKKKFKKQNLKQGKTYKPMDKDSIKIVKNILKKRLIWLRKIKKLLVINF